MHVIARKALLNFWLPHPDSQEPLARWYKVMEASTYTSIVELRRTFPSADLVDDFVVFNIGGNKYRLVAAIHYNRGKVYIRHILTHQEYDRGSWKK